MPTTDLLTGILAFVLFSFAIYLTWQRLKDLAERSRQENQQRAPSPTKRQLMVIALVMGLSLLAAGLVSLLLRFLVRS